MRLRLAGVEPAGEQLLGRSRALGWSGVHDRRRSTSPGPCTPAPRSRCRRARAPRPARAGVEVAQGGPLAGSERERLAAHVDGVGQAGDPVGAPDEHEHDHRRHRGQQRHGPLAQPLAQRQHAEHDERQRQALEGVERERPERHEVDRQRGERPGAQRHVAEARSRQPVGQRRGQCERPPGPRSAPTTTSAAGR
jgi:hypothetical protein